MMLQYSEGKAAFYRGLSSVNSPYSDTKRRIPWVKGWFDAKRDLAEVSARLDAGQSIQRNFDGSFTVEIGAV